MQLHSPAYFPFGKADQIGTTRSFASLMHTWIKLESALQNRNNSQNNSQPLLTVMIRAMMSSNLMQSNLIVLWQRRDDMKKYLKPKARLYDT